MAALVALVSLCTYYSTSSENPVTGEKQRVGGITPKQEIAFGLRAAPQMAAEFGGLDPDRAKQEAVKQMGRAIVAKSDARKSAETNNTAVRARLSAALIAFFHRSPGWICLSDHASICFVRSNGFR